MKLIPVILISTVFLTSCSKTEGISFCEGLDPDGSGVKCGKKFTTGDLTAVISSDTNFEADEITLKIKDITSGRDIVVKKMNLKVNRESKMADTNLPFYNEGTFRVDALKDSELLSSGTVTILDTP